MQTINWNDTVRVRLTDEGRAYVRRSYEALFALVTPGIIRDRFVSESMERWEQCEVRVHREAP